MDTVDKKDLVLVRQPPGDRWAPVDDKDKLFNSLTEGLEYVFQVNKGQIKEFHLSSFDGKIYTVTSEEVAPPPPKTYSLYGEDY